MKCVVVFFSLKHLQFEREKPATALIISVPSPLQRYLTFPGRDDEIFHEFFEGAYRLENVFITETKVLNQQDADYSSEQDFCFSERYFYYQIYIYITFSMIRKQNNFEKIRRKSIEKLKTIEIN